MARLVKRDRPVATVAHRAPKSPRPVTVTDSDIARRAYGFYLARGCEHGHDVDDWLRARRELNAAATPTVVTR
jgi:hypothetical protein